MSGKESRHVDGARSSIQHALAQMDKRQYLNALSALAAATANLLGALSVVLKERP